MASRIWPTTSLSEPPAATSGSMARTTSASSPSSDRSLPRRISFDFTRSMSWS